MMFYRIVLHSFLVLLVRDILDIELRILLIHYVAGQAFSRRIDVRFVMIDPSKNTKIR
jgi:hypothetical protein